MNKIYIYLITFLIPFIFVSQNPLGGDFFEFECGNELISISLDEIEDPCDLYNYISENCPDNLDLLPPGLIGMDFIDCGEGDGDGEGDESEAIWNDIIWGDNNWDDFDIYFDNDSLNDNFDWDIDLDGIDDFDWDDFDWNNVWDDLDLDNIDWDNTPWGDIIDMDISVDDFIDYIQNMLSQGMPFDWSSFIENESSNLDIQNLNENNRFIINSFDINGKLVKSNTENTIIFNLYNDGSIEKNYLIK